ncbi:MAG: VIT domain-containing protein [Sphingomicrobium sp.]
MRGLKCATAIGLGLAIATIAEAATQNSRPVSTSAATLPKNPSVKALVRGINDAAHAVDLDIRKLDVNVQLRGGIAETVMDMQLFAPARMAGTPLEGRVHIDLPPGSIVTGYALDVNGGMVDASLVDQSTARAAYEQQVRKNVDPGLGEVDQAGGFNTRIFPVDAQKGRRLRLRFVTPLSGDYQLPLHFAGASEGWSIRVSEPGVRSTPKVQLGRQKSRETVGLTYLQGTGAIDDVLRIDAPRSRDAIASRHSTGEAYWQLAGSLPRTPNAQGGTLRVYWDRSRSRRDHDHASELSRILEAIEDLRPDTIEWVAFSSGAPERATLTNAEELKRKVDAVRYSGATTFAGVAGDGPAQVCLLVSDGRSTLDTSSPPALPCQVFAIAPKNGDFARLGVMTQATGGLIIPAGTGQVDWRAPRVTAVNTEDGARTDFINLPAGSGEWRIAVRAPASGAVRVRIGDTVQLRFASPDPTRFDGEGTLLAANRLAAIDSVADRTSFVAMSRRYSVASPSLSFTVLERPEDYVLNKIEPSATYTRRAEWAQLAAEAAEDEADAKAKRFDVVLKDWQEQVSWWEKSFDLNAKPKRPDEAKSERQAAMAGPPPPPPPPAPPPPAVAELANDIVVTGARAPAARANAAPARPDIQIAVSAWRPDRDYLNAFDADPAAFDAVFADWEKKAGDVPSFYLDTADWLARRSRNDLALEVLLSALDLPTANEITVGMVAARLERWGKFDLAIALRERQAMLDPSHPQPRRLLALALARRATLAGNGARADLEKAISLLTDIALSPMDIRWRGIDMISLNEANAFLPRLKALGGSAPLDPRLVRNLASDVRVVLDWSNDAADIDLWVDEPNGERAIYRNPRTLIGGHLSDDMTSGFGPEEYFLRRAADGRYTVRANVYASDRLDPNGSSRVTARLIRDWGRPTEREEGIDLDLQRGHNGEVRIGTLKVEGPSKRETPSGKR